MIHIENRIAYFRNARGMTQAQLADKLDVNQATVSTWEHGKSGPAKKYVPRICAILGVREDELFIRE